MTGVCRIGDLSTPHCYPARPVVTGSNDVFINGIGAVSIGDYWIPHTCGDDTHDGTQIGSSNSVFVNGKGLARIGDNISCGTTVMTGSTDVFSG